MRQILLGLVCLSTFAAAQNVLAIAPAHEMQGEASLSAAGSSFDVDFVSAETSYGRESAPAGTMALMVAGLAGLTIAGGRRHERGRNPA